jgi:hypothetical protein
MSIDIRLPQINGSEKEQLNQIRSYLFQLASQLQWALKNVDASSNSVIVQETPKSLAQSKMLRTITPDAQATFASIKALIIKSAEIVDAYYEEINKKLEGQYVAQSDFGIFEEQTSQDVYENSKNITRAFSNVQQIKSGVDSSLATLTEEINEVDSKVADVESNLSTDIETLNDTVKTINTSIAEIDANIKTGLLEEKDGLPIYGVEIRQKNIVNGVEVFNKFARFTAGRLSFYDQNGFEVAYISDYKLYITHAEVTGTLKLGGYSVDTTNGLTFKWVGRG